MLRYTATDDKILLDWLNNEIFGEDYTKGVGYVLYDGNKPIGIAQMKVSPEFSVLESAGIIPSERGKGNGDFFTRSLIWGMSNVSEELIINAVRPYFAKFGFKEENGVMKCLSKDVVFPCDCHK